MTIDCVKRCSCNPVFGQVKGLKLKGEYKKAFKDLAPTLNNDSSGLNIEIKQIVNKAKESSILAVASPKYSLGQKLFGSHPSAIGIATVDIQSSKLSAKEQIQSVIDLAKSRLSAYINRFQNS